LKGVGQKQQSISGEVAIFFLHTRKPLLSPFINKRKYIIISLSRIFLHATKCQITGSVNSSKNCRISITEHFTYEKKG
jgi:hypothetical protein